MEDNDDGSPALYKVAHGTSQIEIGPEVCYREYMTADGKEARSRSLFNCFRVSTIGEKPPAFNVIWEASEYISPSGLHSSLRSLPALYSYQTWGVPASPYAGFTDDSMKANLADLELGLQVVHLVYEISGERSTAVFRFTTRRKLRQQDVCIPLCFGS